MGTVFMGTVFMKNGETSPGTSRTVQGGALRIRRIEPWPFVRTTAIITSLIGFAAGFVLGALCAVVIAAVGLMLSLDIVLYGVTAFVVLPIAGAVLYGLVGIGLSSLIVLLYNLTAGLFGGIRLECDEESRYPFKKRSL